jgi:hypothetical protein
MYFVWRLDNSFNGIEMPFDQDPKSGIRIFMQKIYTTRIILIKYYLIECYSRTPSTIAVKIST